jgi:hypothetical protein
MKLFSYVVYLAKSVSQLRGHITSNATITNK